MKSDVFKNVIVKKAENETPIPSGLQERTEYERMLPTYVQQWARIVSEQQAEVSKLAVDKDEKFGKLLKYFRFDDTVAWGDSQIKSQILSHPEYVSICRDQALQQSYLDYVKDILDTIKGNHFIIQEYNKMKQASEGTI